MEEWERTLAAPSSFYELPRKAKWPSTQSNLKSENKRQQVLGYEFKGTLVFAGPILR